MTKNMEAEYAIVQKLRVIKGNLDRAGAQPGVINKWITPGQMMPMEEWQPLVLVEISPLSQRGGNFLPSSAITVDISIPAERKNIYLVPTIDFNENVDIHNLKNVGGTSPFRTAFRQTDFTKDSKVESSISNDYTLLIFW